MENVVEMLERDNIEMPLLGVINIYSSFLEIASVQNGKINSFSPLTKDTLIKLSAIASASGELETLSGHIPSELVYLSVQPSGKSLAWKETAKEMRDVILIDGTFKVSLPKMLFVVKDKSLSVYSYKGGLQKNTKLYDSPLPNGTAVCLGNIKIHNYDNISQIIKEYRRLYWNSQFEGKFNKVKQMINEVFTKESITTYGKLF